MKTLWQVIGTAVFLYAVLFFALGREPAVAPVVCNCDGRPDCHEIVTPSLVYKDSMVRCAVIDDVAQCCIIEELK